MASYPTPNGGIPVTANTIFKVTFFLNGPNCGWSETYYINPGTTTPDGTTFSNISNAYASARLRGMTNDYSLEALRYGDVTVPGASRLLVPSGWPLPGQAAGGSTAGLDGSATIGAGMQARLSDSTLTIRRNEIYRGISVRMINNTKASPSGVSTGLGDVKAFQRLMLAWMKNVQGATQNKTVGNATLRYFVKDPAVNPSTPIVGITSTNGMLTILTATAVLPPFTSVPVGVGFPLQVSGVRIKCARKVNGIATVIQVIEPTTQQPNIQYVLCKPLCCLGTPILCPRNGKLRPVLYAYSNVQSFDLQQIANRKTGRPFRQRPGRQLHCC